jgi:hypothetical protein
LPTRWKRETKELSITIMDFKKSKVELELLHNKTTHGITWIVGLDQQI